MNFRRKLPRHRTPGRLHSMKSWPAAWDVLNHRRPHRRATSKLLHELLVGADPDELLWPLAKKPHLYFW